MTTKSDFQKLISSWTEASADLGINIDTNFLYKSQDHSTLFFPVFVPFFGSERGTVIFLDFDQKIASELVNDGFGYSTAGNGMLKYYRPLFIDILEDWGFCGPSILTPDWYTHRDF